MSVSQHLIRKRRVNEPPVIVVPLPSRPRLALAPPVAPMPQTSISVPLPKGRTPDAPRAEVVVNPSASPSPDVQEQPYKTRPDTSYLSDGQKQDLIWGKITPEELAARRAEAQSGTDALNAEQMMKDSGVSSSGVPAPSPSAIIVPTPNATRPRWSREPDALTKDIGYMQQLRTNALYNDARDANGEYVNPDDTHKPSRGRAFLITAFRHLGQAMQNAQARANAQGRRVDWSDVAAGGAEALGAGGAAAIDTTIPLREERARLMDEAQKRTAQDFALQKGMTDLAHIQSETAKNNAAVSGQVPEDKKRKGMLAELSSLYRLAGNRLDQKNPRVVELMSALNMPLSKGGKAGGPLPGSFYFDKEGNAYGVHRTASGNYAQFKIDRESGEPVDLSEGERQRLEYDRLENNRRTADFVAKYGHKAAEAAGLRVIPSPEEAAQAESDDTDPMPAPGNDFTPAGPEVSVGGSAPKIVVPLPASSSPAIPENMYVGPPIGRSYGRGGSRSYGYGGGSGGSDEKGRSIAYNKAASSIERIEQLRTQADGHYRRGEYEKADAAINEMNALADTLSKNPNTRPLVNITSGQDHRGKRWVKASLVGDSASSPVATQQKIASEHDVAEFARANKISVERARSEFQRKGYTIQ